MSHLLWWYSALGGIFWCHCLSLPLTLATQIPRRFEIIGQYPHHHFDSPMQTLRYFLFDNLLSTLFLLNKPPCILNSYPIPIFSSDPLQVIHTCSALCRTCFLLFSGLRTVIWFFLFCLIQSYSAFSINFPISSRNYLFIKLRDRKLEI